MPQRPSVPFVGNPTPRIVLDTAKLLTKYGRDRGIDFIRDNQPEPSRHRPDSGLKVISPYLYQF